MENRRPPRSNSSDQKPSFGQGRGAPPVRDRNRPGNPTADGQRRTTSAGDGRTQPLRTRANDSRYRDSGQEGRFGNDGGRRFGPGRFDNAKGDPRARGRKTKSDPVENEIKITCEGQITDGRFRGRTLHSSPSPKAPHTDRKLRELVFKILSRRVAGGRILDLGAGCGTIGIEALSRGAMLATFVERSARMCTMIRKNLADIGIKDGHGEVAETEIHLFLKRAALRKRVWDLIYFDLPECEERKTILDGLSNGGAIKSRGLLVIEHTPEVPHPDNVKQLRRWRTIDHGERILTIYERL
ncbi:MAG: RsmD family RNA methyltransferase [Pyrinomonadaceae bacterium]